RRGSGPDESAFDGQELDQCLAHTVLFDEGIARFDSAAPRPWRADAQSRGLTMTAHPLLPPELQLVSAFVLVCFLGWVVHLIRGRRLSLRDSLLWLVFTFGVLLLTLFPDALRSMAIQLRIEFASSALFSSATLHLVLHP